VRKFSPKSLGLRRYANTNHPEPYKTPVVATETPTLEGPVRVDYR
jgi:hypothetical protein